MQVLTYTSAELNMIALTIIRSGIGALFIGHGFLKIYRGKKELIWTGQQMKNLGIDFAPLFWGICAMLSEFVGGMCLMLGLCTRIAAFFLSSTMIVAIIYHFKNGDSYGYYSFPMSQLVVFIAFIIAGGGIYSLDHILMIKRLIAFI